MKKILNYFVLLLLIGFVNSCNVAGEEDKLVAPEMGSPEDITMENVTSKPQDKTEAMSLYTEVSNIIVNKTNPGSRSNNGSRLANSSSSPIVWSEGETISVSGKLDQTSFMDDALADYIYGDANSLPQGSYDPIMSMTMKLNLVGAFTNAILSDSKVNNHTYTVNGKLLSNAESSASMSAQVGSSEANSSMNGAISMKNIYGAAVSIVREDGLGAKFIFSYAEQTSLTFNKNNMAEVLQKFEDEQLNTMVDVKVYDSSDALIDSYQVSLSELSLIPTPSMPSV